MRVYHRLARRTAAVLMLASLLGPGVARSGTTGKLAGTVTDAKRQPLTGVNIALPEARLGALTDAEGRYTIFNVPAGTHTLKANLHRLRAGDDDRRCRSPRIRPARWT